MMPMRTLSGCTMLPIFPPTAPPDGRLCQPPAPVWLSRPWRRRLEADQTERMLHVLPPAHGEFVRDATVAGGAPSFP